MAARELKWTIQPWEVRATGDFDKVFAAIGKQRPDGLYVMGGPVVNADRIQIVGFALKSRLPSIYSVREFVDAGGLMSYGADEAESYRRVAYFVDRILKGAQAPRPADRTADEDLEFHHQSQDGEADGLTIPPEVLSARASG